MGHFGVPIVGLPFLGDQLITAFLLEDRGAGIRLPVPRLTAPMFAEKVKQVATEPSYAAAARRIGGIGKLSGGVQMAANAIQAVTDHTSEHLQTLADTYPDSTRVWD